MLHCNIAAFSVDVAHSYHRDGLGIPADELTKGWNHEERI
jgi:hypothetical protein